MELETRRGWSSPFFKKGAKQRDRIRGSFDLVENLSLSLSLSLLLSSTRFNGFPCGVYTSSARCLLAIVRRLSPPSRRKNEIWNGIKGWVGGKKVGG